MPQLKQSEPNKMSIGNQIGTGFMVSLGGAVVLGVIITVIAGLSKSGSLVMNLPAIDVIIFSLSVLYTLARCFWTGVWFPALFGGGASGMAGFAYMANVWAAEQNGGATEFTLSLLGMVPYLILAVWVFAAIMAFLMPAMGVASESSSD
ncbi:MULTISPECIES: hypothetical protein [Burkholderiaceae]|jgi:hypothetical protein|uniref:hypothetical protein n=1 Tax=Burkholderiaceae TaxID=119060 RepID=UPI0004701D39|nr:MULTISPECIES: hypothetical protein [Burkholderiaceae]PZR42045.1 MAG: hypothetical protein DI523_32000 [Paraburkholderia fungorum]